MSKDHRQLFSREPEDKEQPGDFLRRFCGDMRAQAIKDEKERIEVFKDYLKTGSVTDK
jgi:hypothetical protein